MDAERQEKLNAVLENVLEQFAFMFCDPVTPDELPEPDGELMRASMAFTGPTSGRLTIAAPRELAPVGGLRPGPVPAALDQSRSRGLRPHPQPGSGGVYLARFADAPCCQAGFLLFIGLRKFPVAPSGLAQALSLVWP